MSHPTGPSPFKNLSMGHLFILLAVVSAILTFVIFQTVLAPKPQANKVAVAETKPLVVAVTDLMPGEIIASGSVQTIEWPANHYPAGPTYSDVNALLGRIVKSTVGAGQPLFSSQLAGGDSGGGLPVVIPKGYRAMTILVTENKGVGGFIRPGDHVDIIGSFEYRVPEAVQKALAEKNGVAGEDSFNVTQTVLQDVLVLAIAQEMYLKKDGVSQVADATTAVASKASAPQPVTDDPTKAKLVTSVTFALTPEQAEKLAFADFKGDLRLTLRPENEHDQVDLYGAVTEDVVPMKNLYQKGSVSSEAAYSGTSGGSKKSSGHWASPKPPVELIEGLNKTTVSF